MQILQNITKESWSLLLQYNSEKHNLLFLGQFPRSKKCKLVSFWVGKLNPIILQ